jgi:hypothetical protein
MQSKRYELKMVCTEMYLPDVRAWVRIHPALFFERYPPRRVNSLYFDTLEGDCISANLLGLSERQKLRLRWYGEDCTSVQGVLELKCKEGQIGWKEHSPLKRTLDLTRLSWPDLMQHLREDVSGPFAIWLSHIHQPVLITSYAREYYESADRQVRVTIDYDLKAYDQVRYTTPNFTCPATIDSVVVVELKAEAQLHRRVSNILSSLPMQVVRNSKYVSGMMGSLGFL